ncbi:hypothetical protein Phou_094080 [Phytohabitans houttuyneae]|uniref:Uncharacterized protein n=1 Tax=Phytohabitans houttuyneae TaxID=1076126 RepID=A0A6V8KRH2_9ACTN|nr:hypothetical protein Phou_094080 [Phytohabitans houttuyneae]
MLRANAGAAVELVYHLSAFAENFAELCRAAGRLREAKAAERLLEYVPVPPRRRGHTRVQRGQEGWGR